MIHWSPDKAIAILIDNKVKGFFCASCKGKLSPWKFKTFKCQNCGLLYGWKVEEDERRTAG